MDLKPVFLPKSPPPAHKQNQEGSTPTKNQHDGPLDLSYRPDPRNLPLDLTVINKPKPPVPAAPTTRVPVPTSSDDDVIVVDVKRGRGAPALKSTPRTNRTVFSMCQKETYTGGVAYTPFDISAGLIRLRQMIRMAKDPQHARQMAQAFQRRALHMLVKSRIQQQQKQGGGGGSDSGPSSSSSLPFSPVSPSAGSRSSLPRPVPSAALGRPIDLEGRQGTIQNMTPTSSSEGFARVSERSSPVVQHGISSEPTSVHIIQPVLVVTSINAMSKINSSAQVTSGSPGSSTPVHMDKPMHPAFAQRSISAVTVAESSGSFSAVTVASSQVTSVSSTSMGISSSNTFRSSPMTKVSSAGNFESEYMKYVRSKRFMSGGSTITEERQTSSGGKPEQVKLENSPVGKKMIRPSMDEYQYLLSEISKMTKMAETIHREKHREGSSAPSVKATDPLSPPPAHSKIRFNVNPKMPHRNPHLFRCPPVRQPSSHSVPKFMSHMGYVSKGLQPKSFPEGTKVPPPQNTEASAQNSTISGPMANRPVVSNVKTWTPPVGQTAYVKQVINEENMKDVKELIKIPHVKFAERKSPVKNDKEEFQRIYSTPEQTEGSTSARSGFSSAVSESKSLQPENNHSQTDFSDKAKKTSMPSNEPVTVNVNIELHGGVTPKTAQVLSYGPKIPSLIIPPPVTRVISPVTKSDTTLSPNVTANSPVSTNIPKMLEENASASICSGLARKTVVKPVTSTFIGWNVSGYKRIPVANVNPIKVQEGAQLDVSATTASLIGQTSNQVSDTLCQTSSSTDNTRTLAVETVQSQFGASLNKPSTGQKCLILPKPNFTAPFDDKGADQGILTTSTVTDQNGKQSATSDATTSLVVPEVTAATSVSKDETAKPKKRKKARELDGGTVKPKPQKDISKPKVKKLKVESEGSKPADAGSASVDAKTEAIKAILRDDFKSKVTEVDSQPSGLQASSPPLKKSKTLVRTKGVCFHSDEESDGKQDTQVVMEDGVSGQGNAPVKVKRRKRSKNLLRQKGHTGKKKLKATPKETIEQSYTNQEVEQQEVYPATGDSGGIPTGKLVVKISKKKRKKKAKIAKYDSNRERCSQLITYNKNAKYEQELLRDEERRLVLKAKRQARKSVRSDSSLQSETSGVGPGPSGHAGSSFTYIDEDSYKFGSESSWQGVAGSSGNHGSSVGGGDAYSAEQDNVQYEVESQPMGRRRLHTGVKLKRIVRKAMVEDQLEAGSFADEEDSGFPRRRLKRRRRRRWYKKRKPFVYVPVNYQLCMGEVDDGQYEGHYMPLEPVEPEPLPDPESSFQEAFVDPELLAELKGVMTCRETGETKLHRLTRMGHQDLALRCIEAKLFSVNARDHAGYTPLHESCVTGRLRVAKSLLQHGADVNIAAQDGTRPLHDAVDHNRLELVRLLLSHGADPHTATYSGKTPLKLARTPDMQRLIKGHLQDVGGVQQADNVDMWMFAPPWEDKEMEHLGCDVLCDPPSDSSSGEEEVEFELWDSDPLSCHYLELDPEQGHRNYYLLRDVSTLKNIPEDDFKLLNFDLSYEVATKASFSQKIGSSDTVLVDSVFGKYKKVDFVEASSSLKSLLEIDRCCIAKEELIDGHLNDLSFSETPTERLLLEGCITSDTAEPIVNPTAFCSRKLDFSQSEVSCDKPGSSILSCNENSAITNIAQETHQMETEDVHHDSLCSSSKASGPQEEGCSSTVGPGGDDGLDHGTGEARQMVGPSNRRHDGEDDGKPEEEYVKAEETENVKECSSGSVLAERVQEGAEQELASAPNGNNSPRSEEADANEPVNDQSYNEAVTDNGKEGQIGTVGNVSSGVGNLGSVLQEKPRELSQVDHNSTTNPEVSNIMPPSLPSTSSLKENEPTEGADAAMSSDKSLTVQQDYPHCSMEESLPVLEKHIAESGKVTEKQETQVATSQEEEAKRSEVQGEEMPCLTPCL